MMTEDERGTLNIYTFTRWIATNYLKEFLFLLFRADLFDLNLQSDSEYELNK